MTYVYIGSQRHEPGTTLDNGPYRLNPLLDADAGDCVLYTHLVEPLSPVVKTFAEEGEETRVQRFRVKAVLMDPSDDDFEALLPSLDFDLNPALDSFLDGDPSPRIVQDHGRDFLIACVGDLNDIPIYAITKVAFKRRMDIVSGLLTLREAFRYSPNPVFLTQEFSSYSLRRHADFGTFYLPQRGLRYSRLTATQQRKRLRRIKRKLSKWAIIG